MKFVEHVSEYKCSHFDQEVNEEEEQKKFEADLKNLFKSTLKTLLAGDECTLTLEQRYKLVSQFFGINSISLISKGIASETRQLRHLQKLRRRHHVIGHNYQRQKEILMILQKPVDEKRSERELLKLEPLIS